MYTYVSMKKDDKSLVAVSNFTWALVISSCNYIRIYIFTYKYVYELINIFTHIYRFIIVYLYIYICIHTYINIRTYIHIHTHINIYMHTYIYTHAYIYTYLNICIHKHVYTFSNVCAHMYNRPETPWYPCTQAQIKLPIWTHIHTLPHSSRPSTHMTCHATEHTHTTDKKRRKRSIWIFKYWLSIHVQMCRKYM